MQTITLNPQHLTIIEKELLVVLIKKEQMRQYRFVPHAAVTLKANHRYNLMGYDAYLTNSLVVRKSKNFFINQEMRVEILDTNSLGKGGFSDGVYPSLATLRLMPNGRLLPVKEPAKHPRVYKAFSPSSKKEDDQFAITEYEMNQVLGFPAAEPVFTRDYEEGKLSYRSGFTMEWIQGNNLLQIIKNMLEKSAPAPIELMIQTALNIIEQIEGYHLQGVVHCDIKPNNIFVQHEPYLRVRVGDLGLARTLENCDQAIETTPGFAAPELVPSGKPSPASDIFALGRTLMQYLGDPCHFIGFRYYDCARYFVKKLAHIACLSPGQYQEIELALNATQSSCPQRRISLAYLKKAFMHVQFDFELNKTDIEIKMAIDRALFRTKLVLNDSSQLFSGQSVFNDSLGKKQTKLFIALFTQTDTLHKKKLLVALLLSVNCFSLSIQKELFTALGKRTVAHLIKEVLPFSSQEIQKNIALLFAIANKDADFSQKVSEAHDELTNCHVAINHLIQRLSP